MPCVYQHNLHLSAARLSLLTASSASSRCLDHNPPSRARGEMAGVNSVSLGVCMVWFEEGVRKQVQQTFGTAGVC